MAWRAGAWRAGGQRQKKGRPRDSAGGLGVRCLRRGINSAVILSLVGPYARPQRSRGGQREGVVLNDQREAEAALDRADGEKGRVQAVHGPKDQALDHDPGDEEAAHAGGQAFAALGLGEREGACGEVARAERDEEEEPRDEEGAERSVLEDVGRDAHRRLWVGEGAQAARDAAGADEEMQRSG